LLPDTLENRARGRAESADCALWRGVHPAAGLFHFGGVQGEWLAVVVVALSYGLLTRIMVLQ